VNETLIVLSSSGLDEMVQKGNLGFYRGYLEHFHRVNILLYGRSQEFHRKDLSGLRILSTSGRLSRIRWVGLVEGLFGAVRQVRGIQKDAAGQRLDVVIQDAIFGVVPALAIRALRLPARLSFTPIMHPPTLYEVRGRSVSGLPKVVEIQMTKLLMRLVDQILVGSASPIMSEWVREQGFAWKMTQVSVLVEELPSDFALLQPLVPPARRRGRLKEPTLLYVGRLAQEKQVEVFVPLIASLVKRGVRPQLHVLGDGPSRTKLTSELARRNLSANVTFHGWVSAAEVSRAMASADIFVGPLTGSSLREAGLMGMPCVVFDQDWVRGSLTNRVHAILADPNETDSLAAGVSELCEKSDLRQKLSENIFDLFRQRWSIRRLRESLDTAFPSLAVLGDDPP
jgi:glycosyltransferase involved in cell wall biosynthesis